MWDKEAKKYVGYCIDLTQGLADKMDFEYDLVLSKEFGRRIPPHGRWDGLTGDLIHGVRQHSLLLFHSCTTSHFIPFCLRL